LHLERRREVVRAPAGIGLATVATLASTNVVATAIARVIPLVQR
jgi:hypothetical protein